MGPGLARWTTVGLIQSHAYELGQCTGAPIADILSNLHVTLSANAGLADSQRAVFEQSEPNLAARLRLATLDPGINDVITTSALSRIAAVVTSAILGPNAPERMRMCETRSAYSDQLLSAERTITVGVNDTTDETFLAVIRGADTTISYEQISQTGYTAWARLTTDIDVQWQGRSSAPNSPGPNWTLADTDISRHVTVTSVSPTQVNSQFSNAIGQQTIDIAARSVTADPTVRVSESAVDDTISSLQQGAHSVAIAAAA